MKKLSKIIFSLLIFVLAILNSESFCQDYKTLIKNVPGIDKFPDASAINVFTKIDIQLQKDGSYSKHFFYIKKILNYKGKIQYSDIKLDYNANFEKISIGNSFSIRDEKEIPLPKEATHDNGTYMTMYSPEYINQRETVINMPGVEPNDFIVLDYTITGAARSFFSGIEQFQEDNPYLHKEMNISVPSSLNLTYRFDESKIKLLKSTKDGINLFKWSADNVPLIKDEKNRPSLNIIGRPVFYSTNASWNEAVQPIFKQFKSVNYLTDAVKKLMPDLPTTKATDETKLKMIYSYIQKNFIPKYSLSEDDYIPQSPDKLLEQHFGSEKELTALFIAIAKFAGIDVKPVFIMSSTKVKETKLIPCREFINAIAAYYKGIVINVSFKDSPFGFTWEKSFLLTDDNPAQILDFKYDTKDLLKNQVNIHLNDNLSANATSEKELRGGEDYQLRTQYKNQTEKERKISFTSNISDKSITVVEGPEFINIQDLAQNLKIKYASHIDNFYNLQDNFLYMQLPEKEKVNIELTGNERETPYQIYSTISVNEKYIFDNLTKGYTVIKPEAKVEKTFKSADGDMSYSVNAVMEGGKLAVYCKIFIPETIISKEDYPAFSQFISSIQKPLNNLVFLKK